MRTIVVIKGIPFPYYKEDQIIGVEKGTIDLLNQGIIPSLAVGDFDSVNEEEYLLITKKCKVCKLNPIKDDTDLDHALSLAKGEEIIILGGIHGKRQDHFFANMKLFYRYPNLHFIDSFSEAYLIQKGTSFFNQDSYTYVSFFSMVEESVLSLIGFKYPLDHYHLSFQDNLCISNEVEKGTLILDRGTLLVIKSKKDA